MEPDYDYELDCVLDQIRSVIIKHKAAYEAQTFDWLPDDESVTELSKRKRGSRPWIIGKWLMIGANRLQWYQSFTGRRKNLNVFGDAVWQFESFEDRIRNDADLVFRSNRFFGADQRDDLEWSELRKSIIETYLRDSQNLIPV